MILQRLISMICLTDICFKSYTMTPTELHIVKLGTLAWLNEVYQRLEELRYCDNDLQYFYELCSIKKISRKQK